MIFLLGSLVGGFELYDFLFDLLELVVLGLNLWLVLEFELLKCDLGFVFVCDRCEHTLRIAELRLVAIPSRALASL